MTSIPGNLRQLIVPLSGGPQLNDMLLSPPGVPPAHKLSQRARVILGLNSRETEMLMLYLHRMHFHIYCYCQCSQPSTSHVKLRKGTVYCARNPASPMHATDCPLHNPIHVGRNLAPAEESHTTQACPPPVTGQVSPPETPIALDLLGMTSQNLLAFYRSLLGLSGRNVWVPGNAYVSARPLVDAVERFSLAKGIPLSWFFKGRDRYLPDLVNALKRRKDLWPDGVTPHGLVYTTPDSVDYAQSTITIGGQVYSCSGISATPGDHGAQSGLAIFDANGRCRAAALQSTAGRRQDWAVKSPTERRLAAYLMKTLSNWHENPKYKTTLSIETSWDYSQPEFCASMVVKGAKGEVPILALGGDVDDSPRLKSFERVFAGKGVVVDYTTPDTNKQHIQHLNQHLFDLLVARRPRQK